MLVSNVSYPQYSRNYLSFEGRKPSKKALELAKEKLGPRPSKELLEELINKGLSNEEIATKLKRAVQTIVGLRCIYKLPSEREMAIQKRTQRVIEELSNGGNRTELAKELGVCKGTINLIAEKYGLFDKHRANREKLIIEMIKNGATRPEIATTLNISVDTVSRIAKNYGISFKNSIARIEDAVINKILGNEPNKKIMEELNISGNTIQKIKKEHGLIRTYNRLPCPQPITWTEIVEESKKVTELRKAFKRLKEGERNLEILEEISNTLDNLKNSIEKFKARF